MTNPKYASIWEHLCYTDNTTNTTARRKSAIMVFRDLLNQYLDNLDRNMKIYLVIAFAFLLIYGWFIRTAFKGPKFLCRFIVKKILLAFILGVFLPFCDPVNKGSPLNALSLAFVLIYL